MDIIVSGQKPTTNINNINIIGAQNVTKKGPAVDYPRLLVIYEAWGVLYFPSIFNMIVENICYRIR